MKQSYIVAFLVTVALTAAVTYGLTRAYTPRSGDISPVVLPEGSGVTRDTKDQKQNVPEATVSEPAVVPAVPPRSAIVDFSNAKLTTVPSSVFTQLATEALDLSHNALSGALPAEIRHLQKLRSLDLSHNTFTGVPAEIGQLQQLEILNLSNNPITGLPHELANLRRLKVLDLRETQYSAQDLEIIQKGLPADVQIRL